MRYNTIRQHRPAHGLEIVDMTRKFIPDNADDLVHRYKTSTPISQLASEAGVTDKVIKRIMIEHGITPRTHAGARRAKFPALARTDPEAIVTLYNSGVSLLQLSNASGVSRVTLIHWLKDRGVAIRSSASKEEQSLLQALTIRRIEADAQYPIGSYDVDIAIDKARIAVELQWSKPFANHGGSRTDRVEYILDAGWCVILVCHWMPKDGVFMAAAIADQIASLVQSASRKPSLIGKYGVIWTDGKAAARPSGYLEHRSYVFRPDQCDNSRRYYRRRR
jgi:very-short-patch-repair endonuclease